MWASQGAGYSANNKWPASVKRRYAIGELWLSKDLQNICQSKNDLSRISRSVYFIRQVIANKVAGILLRPSYNYKQLEKFCPL